MPHLYQKVYLLGIDAIQRAGWPMHHACHAYGASHDIPVAQGMIRAMRNASRISAASLIFRKRRRFTLKACEPEQRAARIPMQRRYPVRCNKVNQRRKAYQSANFVNGKLDMLTATPGLTAFACLRRVSPFTDKAIGKAPAVGARVCLSVQIRRCHIND